MAKSNAISSKEFQRLHVKSKQKGEPAAHLQRRCVEWFRDQFPMFVNQLIYVPNEHAHGRIMQAQNPNRRRDWVNPLDMGLTRGASDLLLLVPRGAFGGLCIEMKTATGVVSDAQIDWGVSMLEAGYMYQVVRDEVRFHELVRAWFRL